MATRPDAVFAYNDLMALGAMQELLTSGIRVPDDIAVVGFDDISMCEAVTPRLTSVRIDRDLLGRTAVEQLQALLEHPGDRVPPVHLARRAWWSANRRDASGLLTAAGPSGTIGPCGGGLPSGWRWPGWPPGSALAATAPVDGFMPIEVSCPAAPVDLIVYGGSGTSTGWSMVTASGDTVTAAGDEGACHASAWWRTHGRHRAAGRGSRPRHPRPPRRRPRRVALA